MYAGFDIGVFLVFSCYILYIYFFLLVFFSSSRASVRFGPIVVFLLLILRIFFMLFIKFVFLVFSG